MSLSAALTAALTGLAASQRTAQAVSNNVANATTAGYGARTVVTGSQSAGGSGVGVQVVGVLRQSDPVLTGNRRLADAELGANSAAADFFGQLEMLVGTPDDPGSLSGMLDQFETSLVTAANSPESDAALNGVLFAAGGLAGKLNTISDGIQDARARADTEIGNSANLLNGTLSELEKLNEQILRARGNGGDYNGILDQQQVLIDKVAELVPIKEYRDQNGLLRLYSQDGIKLLDGDAVQIGFDVTRIITPDMMAGGALSSLTIDGSPIPPNGDQPGLSGGRLAGLFDVRDTLAVEAQTRLDAVARDLAERFEDHSHDPTSAPPDPGLFTDLGTVTDPANELGLSQRLSVNAAVDPAQGGAIFRLRDGLGAAAPGDVGNAAVLQGMLDHLANGRVTVSGGFSAAERSMTVLAGEMLSVFSGERQFAETSLSFSATRQQTLLAAETEKGVNTDAELQRLILVEQMYQANARVMEVINDMLDDLQRALT